MNASPLFVRKSDRRRCSRTFGDVGPLFFGASCRSRGEWEIAGQAHIGRFCMAHMLDRLDRSRRHNIGCDGFAEVRPMLCGGHTFCLDSATCDPHCRKNCRALAEPEWLHIRFALGVNSDCGDTRLAAHQRRWNRRKQMQQRRACVA